MGGRGRGCGLVPERFAPHAELAALGGDSLGSRRGARVRQAFDPQAVAVAQARARVALDDADVLKRAQVSGEASGVILAEPLGEVHETRLGEAVVVGKVGQGAEESHREVDSRRNRR